MGGLIAALDQRDTPLGPPAAWPMCLKTAVGLILPTQTPMVLFWGPESVALYNDAVVSILSEKHPHALGRPLRESWAELSDDLERLLRLVRETGQTVATNLHGSGRELPLCDISCSAVPDENGGVGGVLCILSGVSAPARTENLHTSQEELQLLADTLPVLISYMDADRRYRFVNRAYERWFPSRRREQVIGLPIREVIGEQAYAAVEPYMDRVLAGEAFSFEQHMPYTEGEHRHIHVDYVPRRGDGGKVVGFYALVTDVSESKRAEAALRESEERFRNMADHAPVMMWVTDQDGRCTYLNRAWYDFTGQTEAEAEAFGWLQATHPDDQAEAERVFVEANARQEAFRLEYRLRRHDGAYRWAIDAAAPRFGPDGAFLGYVGSVIDIHTRRESEQTIAINEERLRLATDAAELGFWDVDVVNDLLIWPPRLKAMFGISPDVPVSLADFFEGLHPDDREATADAFAAACDPERRALYDVEYRTIGREDGIVRWIAAKGRALFDEDGRCLRVVGTAIDITPRKLVEQQREAEEARLRFFGELDEALRTSPGAAEAMDAVTRLLAGKLGATRCAYADVDTDDENDRFVIRSDWSAPGVPSSAGTYSLDLFGSLAAVNMRQGQTLVVRDVAGELGPGDGREMFQSINIDAIVCCPLVKEGRLAAMMAIHQHQPRDWQPDEIALVEAVVERCWSHVQRVGAEARLRDSEERYRTLFTSIESGFCVAEVRHDDEGRFDYRVIEANPAFYQQTGLPEDILSRWLREAAPGLEEHWFETYGRVGFTGEPHRFEQGSDLLGRWFDVYAFRVGDPHERRVAILFNDISARRNAELALRDLNETLEERISVALAERRLLADLVEGTDAFVQVADMEFRWLAVNKAAADEFERIYGRRPRIGDSMLDLLADMPEHQAAVRSVWGRALEGEEFTEVGEFGDPDRERCFYEMKYNLLRDAEGRQIGAYQFVYDVTERMEEQARLAEAEEALRQSQKMEAMGQLTGGVAHDFNNLLTPIVGTLDLLKRKALGGEREQRLIDGAVQSADRAKTLVQRLLAFARRQPLQAAAVDVATLTRGMADLVASTTGPQIKVMVEAPEDLPAAIADSNQLEMAILNLAVNARDAMPDGGTLRLTVSAEQIDRARDRLKPGRYIRLSVADTGVGMDPATLERAVEPFFSTKGIGKGTGLGLSMVHGLASQLGGALLIHSQPGLGTNVEFWLPASADAPKSATPANIIPEAQQPKGTALLVDDEPLVRATTADMLTELGHEVIEADSGEAALRLLDGGMRPDLLVTDHLMPGITGTELALRVRERLPRTRVLIVSGYADVEGIAPNLPRLLKPFGSADLAAAIGAAEAGRPH